MTRMEQLQATLDLMGNTHSVDDIMALIDTGEMQSFSDGDTWVVTQILDFPRKRVLDLFLVVGELKGLRGLYNRVMEHAENEGCDLVRGFGRHGWEPYAKWNGFVNGQQIFVKELR